MTAKRKAVRCSNTLTTIKKTNPKNNMNTIKKIAACARPTCAKGRFSVNTCAGMGKRAKPRKRAVLQFLPVLENTIDNAGNLPDSEVFSRPEFAGMGCPMLHGFGRDGLVREAGRMALSMFSTSRPPAALENAASGLQSHNGAETMTTVNTTPTPALGTIANQQAIDNALSMALHHIRNGDAHAAVGRAIRAASMLKQACAETQNGSAA